MASGFAGLALRTAVVAAVLSLLFLPSLGRCPSLAPGPAAPPPSLPLPSPPSPPSPSPPPPPALPVLCSDCLSPCLSNCSVFVLAQCSDCDNSTGHCQICLDSVGSSCRERCKRDCAGSCPPALCTDCYPNCTSGCSVSVPQLCGNCAPNSTVPFPCQLCLDGYDKQCRGSCEMDCVGAVGPATCPALISPTPAPAPAPVLCSDCFSHCDWCAVSVPPICRQSCDDITHCYGCVSAFIHEQCEAECSTLSSCREYCNAGCTDTCIKD